MTITSENTMNRMTMMNATRFDMARRPLSFLTFLKTVLASSLERGFTMKAMMQPRITILKNPKKVLTAPQIVWKLLKKTKSTTAMHAATAYGYQAFSLIDFTSSSPLIVP